MIGKTLLMQNYSIKIHIEFIVNYLLVKDNVLVNCFQFLWSCFRLLMKDLLKVRRIICKKHGGFITFNISFSKFEENKVFVAVALKQYHLFEFKINYYLWVYRAVIGYSFTVLWSNDDNNAERTWLDPNCGLILILSPPNKLR